VRSQRSEGLIFVDPQSFSRSKRMTGTLDVQRDHVQLIRAAAALLEADGLLSFLRTRCAFASMPQGCPIFRSRTSLANCCQETSLAILPFVVSACKDAPIDRRVTREKLKTIDVGLTLKYRSAIVRRSRWCGAQCMDLSR
jgi:hypothetical protein